MPEQPAKARVAKHQVAVQRARLASTQASKPAETRAIPTIYPGPRPKGGHRGRPLFVLGTTRQRRARMGVRRGGYYALSKTRKPRPLPRPLAWLIGIVGAFWLFTVFGLLLLGAGLGGAYWYFAKDLPSIDNIHGIQFETTRIYDRHGKPLYEMYDPQAGKRTYVTISQMPKSLIDATIAAEDKSFEKNNGVDPQGILRALYTDFTNKGKSGASTITQQLVRRVLLPERDEKTLTRKIREAILAVQVSQKYSKEKILELYLNEIYYGSLSYGVAAAADTYFSKQVKDLDVAQSAMLAGLPQAPGEYDLNRNFDLAKARQKIVLDLMVENKAITQQQADQAYAEDVRPVVRAANVPSNAPHFVNYVRQVLEDKYGPELANRGGLKVFTTIDLDWQAEAQQIAAQQIENIKRQGASNAALVAINPRTGEILAMVGSVDYTDPRFGEVNVATSLRQPGSSFKPFTYATALEQGDLNPSSILPDLPARFTNGAGLLPYVPQNYDGRFHGPVSMRVALANSFNIPAVETLRAVGVPATLDTAHKLGITTLNDPTRYGLALTLGGGEVTLLDMTSAYATFANYGYHVPTTPFLKIVDSKGQVLEELDLEHPKGKQVISKGTAFQISDMLSDNAARTPAFGPNSPLKIDGLTVAAKTGTTNDWKDSWTMGYTRALAVGVWVGNNDGRPMAHVAGAIGAAPIWHNFIQKVYSDPKLKARLYRPDEKALPEKFSPPPGMLYAPVCAASGMKPTSACITVRYEYFYPDKLPQEEDTWHHWMPVTLHDGGAHIAGPGVPADDIIERIFTTPPDEYKGWVGGGPPSSVLVITPTVAAALPTPVITEPTSVVAYITPIAGVDGGRLANPVGLQQPENPDPIPDLALNITAPGRGQVVTGTVQVIGQADASDFAHYSLEYGPGDGPMTSIADSSAPPLFGLLGMWSTDGLAPGPYTLRLTLETTQGEVVRRDVPVRVSTGEPSVSIASPADNSTVYTGEAVNISVNADGAGANIAGVEVYVDGKRIASLLSAPWSVSWAPSPGTHELSAALYTAQGEQAHSGTAHVTTDGPRPTPTATPVPIMWISNLTLYKEVRAGVNEVWVDVQPGSRVHHVDIYIDGLPAGYAVGPGFRVSPLWTPTPTQMTTPPPTATLDPNAASTATVLEATADTRATRVVVAAATKAARAAATGTARAIIAATNTAVANAQASVAAATTSPTPAPPTKTSLPSPTPTFVRYKPLPDPMLGDYVARCIFPQGRHRVTAIGYDENHHEVGRDETWVVVR